MRKWAYEAVPINHGRSQQGHFGGRKFRGVVEAESGEYAILDLMRRRLYPLSVREMSYADEAVATRLANFKKIKNALSSGKTIKVPTTTAPVSRFHIKNILVLVGWGFVIAAFVWMVLHS